jgi:hypothetical protein
MPQPAYNNLCWPQVIYAAHLIIICRLGPCVRSTDSTTCAGEDFDCVVQEACRPILVKLNPVRWRRGGILANRPVMETGMATTGDLQNKLKLSKI